MKLKVLLTMLLVSASNAEIPKKTSRHSTPYKEFPIILIKTAGGLQRPIEVSYSHGLMLLWERLDFAAPLAEERLSFCPPHTKEQIDKLNKARKQGKDKNLEIVVNEYCLFEMSSWFKSVRPDFPRCQKDPQPFISKILVEKDRIEGEEQGEKELVDISCGVGDNGKFYRFGYQIWLKSGLLEKMEDIDTSLSKSNAFPNKDIVDFELYRFCYDSTAKRLLYTEHKIISPSMLFYYPLKEEDKSYDYLTLNYDNTEFDFEVLKNEYDKILNPPEHLPSDQDLSDIQPRDFSQYKIEQLVTPHDFVFALWKKPTYHYANVQLMHKKVSKLWNHISHLIEEKAKSGRLELNMYTATFNISLQGNEKAQINEHIQLPEIWIKIVHQFLKRKVHLEDEHPDISRGIAIIGNNYLDEELQNNINEYCEKNYCKSFPIEEYSDAGEYVRCCEVTNRIEQLFNINLEVRELLTIEDLIFFPNVEIN